MRLELDMNELLPCAVSSFCNPDVKIAFVEDGIYAYASGSPSAVGGSERAQWLLSRALAAAGWSVIVGVRSALKRGDQTAIDRVTYVGIGGDQVLVALYRFLASERPNWLFRAGADHLWGAVVEVAKLASVRTIFSVACDLDVHPRHATLYRPRCWPLYAWGLSRADRIFVQHQRQLSGLSPRLRSKAYLLPKVCPASGAVVDGTTVKPHAERAKYVAWVGMLGQLKRPDILIDIARRTPAVQYVVCGGPTTFWSPPGYAARMMDDLRATANIRYLGQVPPDEAQQIIADSALLLSTSDVEGFPNTFLQAWSSGTPVVSLTVDPDRIIERHGLGAVSGTMERAIAEISALIASPQRRDEIGGRARRYVAGAYNETAVVTAFNDGIHGASSAVGASSQSTSH
jgi:glycosyltransferase involved in cell wall biosynthesis